VIACIGWGSLIWCQKQLPVENDWQVDGPLLPIEFARQSRDNRITLVVVENTAIVPTLWATLAVNSLEQAKQALATREGISDQNVRHSVGYWSLEGSSRHPEALTIGSWAKERGCTGAVWTALKPRFGDENRCPSEDEVVRHLSGLQGLEKEVAREYVRLAPRQVATPYRRAIEEVLGWTPEGLI
jgi:hypothetical protein